ncbi:MAG: hypothetical protein FVQ85_03000 [Planctomycetes bacterium]|nr:hypothetical protein [Planctomycetota bacterium]
MDNFISRWQLIPENFAAMLQLPILDGDSVQKLIYLSIDKRAIISDAIANKLVCIVKNMLSKAPAEIKLQAVKLFLNYVAKTEEHDASGRSVTTPKILSLNRLYKSRNGIEKDELANQSKWLLGFYLFDIDEVESTFVDAIDNINKKAEF